METPLPKFLDEVDLNVVYSALCHQIKSVRWNIDDEEDWSRLVHLKGFQARIADQLNGGK